MALPVFGALVVLGRKVGRNGKPRRELQHLGRMGRSGDAVAHMSEGRGQKGVMGVVGPRDAREGFRGLRELLGAIEGAAEMAPEALGVVRIEAHRFSDPVDALFGAS